MDQPLDQVSSRALARVASEQALLATLVPAGEESVRVRGPGWKRWLPWSFLALSLFALGGMALGVTSLAEDGWSWADATQMALMGLLVAGVSTQARTVFRGTRAARWFQRPRPTGLPVGVQHLALDRVSAEYLAAVGPATAVRMGRLRAARQAGTRWFDRAAVAGVIVLAGAAFIGMAGVLVWVIAEAGWDDASVWLTAPFTALSGFATWQLFASAKRMSFKGRPLSLISRAFRDSVRLWGSGSVAAKVAVTTTATASVAGAAVVPVVVQRDTPLDMFVRDNASGLVYRIDLATDVSSRTGAPDLAAVEPIALATGSTGLVTGDNRRIPKGSLLVVLEAAQGGQAIVAFPPASRSPVPVARIAPPIPNAQFSGGEGRLFAVQADGAFWHVDLRTGAATQVGQLSAPVGPFAYEAQSKTLVMVSGGQVVRLEPSSGAVLTTNPAPDTEEVCAIADGPGELLFVTFHGRADIMVLKGRSGAVEYIRPTGDAPAQPCELAVAPRP